VEVSLAQLVEGSGIYSLYRNTDGSFYVEGNGEKEVVRDYGSISTISNMVAAETIVYGGQTYRTIVFDGGHTWFADSDWSKNGTQFGDFESLGFGVDYRTYYGLNTSYSGTAPDHTESSGGVNPPAPQPVQDMTFTGTVSSDFFSGGSGNDTFYASRGSDTLEGGDGSDVVIYSDNLSRFTLSGSSTNVVVESNDYPGERDSLSNIEYLSFPDQGQIDVQSAITMSAAMQAVPVTISNLTTWGGAGVSEGDTVYVTVRTTANPITTSLNYSITGVDPSDIGITTSGVIPIPNIMNSPLPEFGSAEYAALQAETGRYDGFIGFNYPAHLIAVGDYRFGIPITDDGIPEGTENLRLNVSVPTGSSLSTIIPIQDSTGGPMAVTSITSSVSEQREGAGQIIFTIATQGYDQGASVDYALSGVSAVDIVGGRLSGSATVGATGSATVTVIPQADNMQEGRETVTISAGGQTASADILDQLGAAASYNVSTLSTSVNEGGQVMFTVTGTGVQSGDFAEYTIGGAGITSSDILGGILTGYATFNASGQATVMVQTSADLTTEGEETLSLTVGEASASVTLNDTSRGQGSYTVNAGSLRVNEGDVAVFTVTGQNVPAGTSVGYTVTGVDASDLQQGTLTGLVVMGPTGVGQIQIPIAADGATEGVESLTVTVGDSSAAVLIGDTSNGTLVKEFTNTIANEVFVATSASNTFEVGARKDQVQIQSFDGGQTWQMTSSDFGTDTIAGFDRVKFSNTTLALDFQSGDAGYNTVMMIGAAFGPTYTQTYFAPGVNLYDQGYSDREVAELIVETGLIEGIVNGDNADWVDFVYSNVAGVKPDALTRQLFANQIADGTTTKADLLVLASENMFEGTVGIPGLQANGLEFSSFA